MASISIKKDFQDGEELFAEQLNLNFATIEAGVNTANKIVWQGENGEEVVAFRGTTEEINNRNIIDGQTLYNIETGETYLDVGSERISTGAGNVVAIGEEEPTNEATKIWINPDEDSLNYQDENGAFKELVIRASDTLPIGFIGLSPSESIPYGWLLCDGSEVSRTSYADLFKVIGVTYGAGNGSTTFNLPNLKGKIPVGLDSSDNDFKSIGATGGEKTHTLTIEEMPSHGHELFSNSAVREESGNGFWNMPSAYEGVNYGQRVDIYKYNTGTNNTGGGQAHNIMQPYIVQNYIIKAKQTVAVVSKTVNEYNTGNDKVYGVDYINAKFSELEAKIGK